MKTLLVGVLAVPLLWLIVTSAAKAVDAPPAESLIRDADRARGTSEKGVTWKITVKTKEEDKLTEVQYEVKVKGNLARMEASGPPPHTGEGMLLRDGDLFFHKPGIKRPMLISASQKLMGPASNGDISATNYARDYDGKVVGEEKVGGADCWKLELKAKPGKKPTYQAIRYWITKADHLGVKSEFLTTSGDIFKTAEYKYENKLSVDNKDTPFVSEMAIKDALKPNDYTNVTVSSPKPEALPDEVFDIHNFMK